MSELVVVGVDGSKTAEKAALRAAELAAAMDGTLHVVSAYQREETEAVVVGSDSWQISNFAEAEDLARNVARDLGSRGIETSSAAGRGKPHELLIQEASRLNATLIVVGNRRMQGAGRLLGSVANSVAHNAPCDVFIVKTT